MSCVALVVLIPLILWAAQRYGGPGAASSWLVYNAGVGILSIGIIHRRILRGQAWRWYTRDVALPLLAVVVVAGIGRLLINRDLPLATLIPSLVVVSAATQGAAIMAVPRARHYVAATVPPHATSKNRGIMTHAMKMTVVIPTRERCATLPFALRTCIEQDYADLEILVSDNASRDDTAAVVATFHDPRIRYVNTGTRCSMTRNWEFALQRVTGDYVTFIGDDDGLLPGAVRDVAAFSRPSHPRR